MEREGLRAVLDDGDGLLAPGHGVADHRCTSDVTYRHRADAGERRLPRSGVRPAERDTVTPVG